MAKLAPLTPWIQRLPPLLQALWIGLSAFAVYFGMYAFRKAFKVGKWEGLVWAGTGMSLKVCFSKEGIVAMEAGTEIAHSHIRYV